MIPKGLQNGDVPGVQDSDVQMTETQSYHPNRKADMSTEGVTPVIQQDLQNGDIPVSWPQFTLRPEVLVGVRQLNTKAFKLPFMSKLLFLSKPCTYS